MPTPTIIRHHCNCVLFETRFIIESNFGLSTDIAIKCPRCSRKKGNNALASFKLKLPRWIAPCPPQPVRCQNTKCLARLCDISLPYTMGVDEGDGDIQILCRRCKTKTRIKLSGIAQIEG